MAEQKRTLKDFVDGVIFDFKGTKFGIYAEERQNHQGLRKATLKEKIVDGDETNWYSVDVWKPGFESSKRAGKYYIAPEIADAFETCKCLIEKHERTLGIADY